VKCIAWNFDGSNFVRWEDEDEALKKLRFENGDTIPNVDSYFVVNDDSDDDDSDDDDNSDDDDSDNNNNNDDDNEY
jgi:hypothetical protein